MHAQLCLVRILVLLAVMIVLLVPGGGSCERILSAALHDRWWVPLLLVGILFLLLALQQKWKLPLLYWFLEGFVFAGQVYIVRGTVLTLWLILLVGFNFFLQTIVVWTTPKHKRAFGTRYLFCILVFLSAQIQWILDFRCNSESLGSLLPAPNLTLPREHAQIVSLMRQKYKSQNMAEKNRVVLVVMDGTGLYTLANHPAWQNLTRRVDQDCVLLKGKCSLPSWSLSNWVTLETGSTPEQTGVMGNVGYGEAQQETIYSRFTEWDNATLSGASIKRGMVAGEFLDLIEDDASDNAEGFFRLTTSISIDQYLALEPSRGPLMKEIRDTDLRLGRVAAGMIRKGYTFLTLHLMQVDEAAHLFGIDSFVYENALADMAFIVNNLVSAIQQTPGVNQTTTLIVTADHGHITAGGHGGIEEQVRSIPIWVYRAKSQLGRAAGIRSFDRHDGVRCAAKCTDSFGYANHTAAEALRACQVRTYVNATFRTTNSPLVNRTLTLPVTASNGTRECRGHVEYPNTWIPCSIAALLGLPMLRECEGRIIDPLLTFVPNQTMALLEEAYQKEALRTRQLASVGECSQTKSWASARQETWVWLMIRNGSATLFLAISVLILATGSGRQHGVPEPLVPGPQSLVRGVTERMHEQLKTQSRLFVCLFVMLCILVSVAIYAWVYGYIGDTTWDWTNIHTPFVLNRYLLTVGIPSAVICLVLYRFARNRAVRTKLEQDSLKVSTDARAMFIEGAKQAWIRQTTHDLTLLLVWLQLLHLVLLQTWSSCMFFGWLYIPFLNPWNWTLRFISLTLEAMLFPVQWLAVILIVSRR